MLRVTDWIILLKPCSRLPQAEGTTSYLKEEVQPEQSTAGDDGKPCRITTGDCFWHVCCILGKRGTGKLNLCPRRGNACHYTLIRIRLKQEQG